MSIKVVFPRCLKATVSTEILLPVLVFHLGVSQQDTLMDGRVLTLAAPVLVVLVNPLDVVPQAVEILGGVLTFVTDKTFTINLFILVRAFLLLTFFL